MHSSVSQKGRFCELSHQLGAEFIDIGNRIHCDHAKKQRLAGPSAVPMRS